MKTIEVNEGYLVLAAEAQQKPMFALAQKRVFLVPNMPYGAQEILPGDVGTQTAGLLAEIKAQVVGLDDATDVLGLGLLSGGNVFMWSLPGAAKSTISRLLAEGVDGWMFRLNLSPATGEEELFGPYSIAALKKDIQERAWARTAVADIAMFDEWDKASDTVRNVLLQAMEEHTVTTNDGEMPIPLLLGIGAANSVLGAGSQNASWDRFLFRIMVHYPDEYADLFDVVAGRKPMQTRIDKADVMLVQGWVDYMTLSMPGEIKTGMLNIHEQLKKKGVAVSGRRFVRWMNAVVASALLDGRDTPTMDDLFTGANILWVNPDEMDEVHKVVGALSDAEKGVLVRAGGILENVENTIPTLSKDTPDVFKTLFEIQAGLKKVREELGSVRKGKYQDEKERLTQLVQKLESEIADKSNEL